MKKLLGLVSITSLLISSTFNLVSCYIGTTNSREYLLKFKDYDWSDDSTGDGFNFDKYNSQPTDFKDEDKLNITNVNNGVVDKILDYQKINTGYIWRDYIAKQTTTGVPLYKAFSPEGNSPIDFGITSKARAYNNFNKLEEWNKINDRDLNYNSTHTDLANRDYVAKKTVDSQSESVVYNSYREHARNEGAFDNNIVGNYNPDGNQQTAYPYIHDYIDWSGVTDEGIVNTPSADFTEAAHKNGVRAFGVIFLRGWQNITKNMVDNMLAKDKNGHYHMADMMIDMCLTGNFDGFMINEEANGSMPNGTILDYNELNKVFDQFKEIRDRSSNPKIKRLKLIWYRNNASVIKSFDSIDAPYVSEETIQSSKHADEIQTDFNDFDASVGENAERNKYFINEFNNTNWKKKLFGFYDLHNNNSTLGTGDYRLNYIGKNSSGQYNEKPVNSFSTFEDHGTGDMAKIIFDALKNSNYSDTDKKIANSWLKGLEVMSMYNSYEYSGINGYMSNDDKGQEFSNKLYSFGLNQIIGLDSRIKKNKEISSALDYQNNNKILELKDGKFTNSRGIGNDFAQFTTITDRDVNVDKQIDEPNFFNSQNKVDPSMSTTFSTGSGIEFINHNEKGERAYFNNYYPWTNIRLEDVNPTYQWDFYSKESNSDTVEAKDADGIKNRTKIGVDGQLSPYYYFHDAYFKGNSIAIGNNYDLTSENGIISPGKWSNNPYNWNIMGANLSDNDYTISYIVKKTSKDSQDKDSDEKINSISKNTKFLYSSENDSNIEIDFDKNQIQELSDGWVKLTINLKNKLNNISSKNRLAKFGLQINPGNNKHFLYNVGKFSIAKNSNVQNNEVEINNVTNEYIVKRNKDNINIRFNWQAKNDNNVCYYEIYVLSPENKWYLVGQTTEKLYYLHSLKETNFNTIKFGIKAVFNNSSSSKLNVFAFDTKYN